MSVVTFTTDFGTADGYVGAMKGVVLSLAQDATTVDITHEIPRHDIAAGAFALAQAAPLFPPGTVHVAVVDPGWAAPARRSWSRPAAPSSWTRQRPAGAGRARAAGGPPDRAARVPASAGQPHLPWPGRVRPDRRAAGPRSHPRDAGPLLPAIEELIAPAAGDPATAVVVHVDSFGNLITSLAADALPTGGWITLVPGSGRPISNARRSDLRRRGQGRAGGLRGQRRLVENRRA
jgi:hypothetical protein